MVMALGNSDAIYMCAIGKAVLEAWEPSGLILISVN